MATFFEKEMKKLFRQGLDLPETVFAGRVCYGKLNEDVRVRMEFATEGVSDQYSALKVTLLNRREGPVDRIRRCTGEKADRKFQLPGRDRPPYLEEWK